MASQTQTAKDVRRHRQRMRLAGFVLRQVWVHPEDWPAVSKLIARLRAAREST